MSMNSTAITTRTEGINPHLFASPRLVAKLALNIAAELGQIDPEGAASMPRTPKPMRRG